MKNLLHFSVVSLMILMLAVGCKKDEPIKPNVPSNPTVQIQAHENDLFYFEGSNALMSDYQMVYYYKNGKFNDPTYNKGSFPAQSFTLINDSTLQVHIKSLYTGAETDIIAHKVPLKYNNYGIAGWTDDLDNVYCVFNGLYRCPDKRFIYTFDCEKSTISIYFLDTHVLMTKNYTFHTATDGTGDQEILIDNINGDRWYLQHNLVSPHSFNCPGLRIESYTTTFIGMRPVDDKKQ